MSFLKKLTSEFKDMFGDEKDKKDGTKGHDNSSMSYGDTSHSGPPQQFNQQYPQHQYGAPPSGAPHQSQLPPGWMQQWDAQSQRWYYVEQSTGRTQWEPPSGDRGFGSGPPPPQGGYGGGYGYPGQQQHGMPQGYPPHDAHYQGHGGEEKHKSSNKGMLAAGAGGLAVGALAGHALSGDSSDEEGHAAYGGGYGAAPAGYGYPAAPPAAAPPLEDNPELSSSQRSSLEEARKEYEEAQKEVAENSSASSSDIEDLQEAREEYHEEIEEAHEELED